MNKILTAIAATALLGAATLHEPVKAQEVNLSNANTEAIDKEVKALVAKVYPAFVLIGGGSGVCISEDGWMLTNHHVWNEAAAPSKQVVKMAGNNRQFTAVAVGADPRGDIVLGKLQLKEGEKVPFAKLADSDKVKVGDICLCVGNPFLLSGQGSEPTVTLGTVSATHRFQGGYNDSIQIDTSINPGNSGGPSFNVDGEIIGINGRNIASHSKRFNTGAGYAIPANQISYFLETMKAQAGGALLVRHGIVGGLDLDLGYQKGARVSKVGENSEASDVGFEVGDVITKMDNHEIFNGFRYYGVVGTKPRNSQFTFTVMRGDKKLEIVARNNVPTESGQFGTVPRPDDVARNSGGGGLGAMMDPFRLPEMKSSLGFSGQYNTDRKIGGYVISRLRPTGDNRQPLEEAGIKVGDIMTHINGRHIMYFADVQDVLIALEPNTEVTVKFIREGAEQEVKAKTGRPSRR